MPPSSIHCSPSDSGSGSGSVLLDSSLGDAPDSLSRSICFFNSSVSMTSFRSGSLEIGLFSDSVIVFRLHENAESHKLQDGQPQEAPSLAGDCLLQRR